MVSHANLLHSGQIHYFQAVVLGRDRSRLDIVLDILSQAAEQELEAGSLNLRRHVHLLPFGRALILREQAYVACVEAQQFRGDQLVRFPPDRLVVWGDDDVVHLPRATLGPTPPQQRRAITKETRARENQPEQYKDGRTGGGNESE